MQRYVIALMVLSVSSAAAYADPLPTTMDDFFLPGTQPNEFLDPFTGAFEECFVCHGNYDADIAPNDRWKGSLMAQSARDVLFHAALAVTNQDANMAGEFCIRCHAPKAWIEGRSTPTDGSAFMGADWEGVTCVICHRMVDPVYKPGISPMEDEAILAALPIIPIEPHNGQLVLDPFDYRRGPFALNEPFFFHFWLESPYHQDSAMCGSCHDVSNPVFSRVGGLIPSPSDTYVATPESFGQPHPTFSKYEMFPLERTYSEWALSDFAKGPIDMAGRFGGNKIAVSSCQDCHMPDASGVACNPTFNPIFRDDQPKHDFLGAATWIFDTILNLDVSEELYPASGASQLTQQQVNDVKAANAEFLSKAADMELSVQGDKLNVRIINQTGHKLPTGYPEGRIMWINVLFVDHEGQLIANIGAYDDDTGIVSRDGTKVYEAKLGIDEAVSQLTGKPMGESFHFVLNNVWLQDNRIPPRGFTNAGFAAVQAAPVNYTYADGQHWDDTLYDIPCNAFYATAELQYQSATREYVEFLRDTNSTNDRGDLLESQWLATGKAPPVFMNSGLITFDDCNKNSIFDVCDLANGTSIDINNNGIPDDCEGPCLMGTIVSSSPVNGAIDARQPHPINNPAGLQGIGSIAEPIVLSFNTDLGEISTDCLILCETNVDPIAGPNELLSVTSLGGGNYAITLARPITALASTTIRYLGDNSVAVWTSHPANVNADSTASVADVLALVDMLNGVAIPAFGLLSQDVDRSGSFGAADILRQIDLLNGAGTFAVYNQTALPSTFCGN